MLFELDCSDCCSCDRKIWKTDVSEVLLVGQISEQAFTISMGSPHHFRQALWKTASSECVHAELLPANETHSRGDIFHVSELIDLL